MSEHTKNRRQNHCRHDVHGGDISGAFFGREFNAIRTMELNICMKNPTRGGKNSPPR